MKRRNTRFTLLFLCCLIGSAAFAQTTIFVNASATGANTGASWADAFVDLQDAIDAANAGDALWVAQGSYFPTKDVNGSPSAGSRASIFSFRTDISVYGGFLGFETTLAQRTCSPASPTVLSGDLGVLADRSDNAYNVCYAKSLSTAFLMDCITIDGGNGVSSTTTVDGSGWYNDATGAVCSPTFRGVIFQNNEGARGGAFYNNATNGGIAEPVFTDCKFISNKAEFGGALYNDADQAGNASPLMTGCSFLGNYATDGGVIYNNGALGQASGTLTNCSFNQNKAQRGGAMYQMANNGTTRGFVNGCTFSQNTATDGGGALFFTAVNGDAKTTYTNCTFTTNRAAQKGGAVWNMSAGPVFETSLFFQNKSSLYGGAIYNDGPAGTIANPRFTSCEFKENSATNIGGAIYNQATFGDASPLVVLCKFIANTANAAGALYNNCVGNASGGVINATYYNCLFSRNSASGKAGVIYGESGGGTCAIHFASSSFAGNTASDGALFYITQHSGGTTTITTYNMASYGHTGLVATILGGATVQANGGMYESSIAAVCSGTCYPGINPQFTNATADDLTLQLTSPAINVGLNAWYLPQFTLDLAGNTRLQGGTIDLGAYETPVVPPPPCPRVIYVNGIATGSNNGKSWANAYVNLQSALAEARINPCIDTIVIAKGVYKPTTTTNRAIGFELVNGIEMFGGFPNTGNPWFPNRDLVAYETILSGDIGVVGNKLDNSMGVLTAGYFPSPIGNANLYAGTIVDGLSVVDGLTGYLVQLIQSSHACETMFRDVRIYNNYSTILRAAAFHVTITGMTTIAPSVKPVFERCSFVNNVGTHYGAVSIWNNPIPTSSNFTPTFKDCLFSNNRGSDAGAIFLSHSASPKFDNCVFDNNRVTGGGGGFGGGVICIFNNPSSSSHNNVVFNNCRLTNNQSMKGGGAIYTFLQGAANVRLDFNNCTISGNRAVVGGMAATYVSGIELLNFNNCIIWDNTASSLGQIVDASVGGPPSALTYNFRNTLMDAASCASPSLRRSGPVSINCVSGMLYNQNPQFINPVGGNYRLALTSPAINAGDNTLVLPTMTTDVAGNPRIHLPTGGIVDMGCYENFAGMLRTAAPSEAESANSDTAPQEAATPQPGFTLYPNPVNDILHLELVEGSYTRGQIVDPMGKIIHEWEGSQTSIQLPPMAAGIYFIRLQTQAQMLTQRFVKQ